MLRRLFNITLSSGAPFGVVVGLVLTMGTGPVSGMVGGLLSGLVFGLAMALFLERQRSLMRSRDGHFEGEPVLFEGPANHFRKIESRGGWLTVTPSRLAFRTHGVNVQNQPLDLPMSEVASVEPCRSLGLVPNGLNVRLRDGSENTFVVTERRTWVRRIREQLGNDYC